MNRNFGMTSGPTLGGKPSGRSLLGIQDAPANSYPLPPKSILHSEDVSHSPFERPALLFFTAFVSGIFVLLSIGLYLGFTFARL